MNTILITGAALVGLPILLHLIMKQEPKRLTFPAFRFLKQKLKTNQRKLRLRHFLLLALRMLLIALFCLTLYQPTFKSDRLNIRGEQPIATVIILDTTPSMGYLVNNETRLAEAQRRARELLDELPEKSPVAIVDTAELIGHWLPDLSAARRRLDERKETTAGQPVTSALAVAYQLLAKVEQETDSPDPLPKLVVVLTDRTAACWDRSRTEDLLQLRETIADPKPVHVVIDFGSDSPTNVGIVAVEMKPQVIGRDRPAIVTVRLGAIGGDGTTVQATVQAKPWWNAKPESFVATRDVALAAGQTREVVFEFRDLKTGLHQVEFTLKTPDKLAFDNSRYLTFYVGETRRILTITDDPRAATFWQAAHMVRDEFSCLVVTPDQLVRSPGGTIVTYPPDADPPSETVTDDLRSFEVVCLLNVSNPQQAHPTHGTLWDRLRPYLRSGGKLIIIPGPDTATDRDGYNVATDIMPGKLGRVLETKNLNPPPQTASSWPAPRDGKNGVIWAINDAALKHPMLQPIADWRQQKTDRVDVLANPRTTRKFWEVTDQDRSASAIVYYLDAEKPADRHPAILERPILDNDNKPAGKVLLLTTRMDIPPAGEEWHDYWKDDSTWFAAFPYLLVRYLAGDSADANFNYLTGATVRVPFPRGRIVRNPEHAKLPVVLDGPGITGKDALILPGSDQLELTIGPPKTNLPGNFLLSVTTDDRRVLWRDGFSVNVPAEESHLQKVPLEAIEELVGPERVFAIERQSTLRDWLNVALGQPIDLFPWLLIAVLILFVVEGLAANRFYRQPKR
ncbi:MAG: BatA and WFA domain-containing protein [Gemmataceae bacterium]|nr:BatA and WFA domain-containing protein [Gemmata sp.]MDW8196249.1 BatA and WFA domain-containing protein [Gemmataceae bacterium]